ncbi:MAG: hypothetical protein QG556_337 [Pseudomonadota bacterium]|nr:hypothetical protein [Pseudomonadota bacterium]
MNLKTLSLISSILLISACAAEKKPDDYGETGKNTAGSTCAYGIGGCTPDEDKSGDFVNY